MSSSQRTSLAEFLEAPERPKGTLTQRQLQGFLFAVATAPELIRPSEWIPEIFDGGDAVYADLDEMQSVLGEVMQLYNTVNDAVLSGGHVPPADCAFRDDVMDNFAPDAPVSQWAQGFNTGYDWLSETWDEYVPADSDLSHDLGTLLMVLGFFSSRSLAEAFHTEIKSTRTFEALASSVCEMLPSAASEFARIGRALGAAYAQAEAEVHAPRRVVRIGRNDPCPCGSGKKYKKCCGASAPS